MKLNSKILILAMIIPLGCVDKIAIELGASESPLIIEGSVTDDPGPYTVKISRAFSADATTFQGPAVTGAVVVISDDLEYYDTLVETGMGYQTTFTQGEIGRTYTLWIETAGGLKFKSSPEKLEPAGTLDSVYFEFVYQKTAEGVANNGFNLYLDATSASNNNNRVRWEFQGSYEIHTDPSSITESLNGGPSVPIACSGSNGANCTCCICWVTVNEIRPLLSDESFSASSNRVFVNFIPVNPRTFQQRYHVSVEQSSLSPEVYNFYKALRDQSLNAKGLFQPPFFELKGNVHAVGHEEAALGVFSASAIAKKSFFIFKNDVPYDIVFETILADCRAVARNSSTTVPPAWR